MSRAATTGMARICVISLVLTVLVAGCGGDDGGPSKEVQALRVEQFQQDIRLWCTTGQGDPVAAADPLATMIIAVNELIEIYRDDPDAKYRLAEVLKTGDKGRLRDVPIKDSLAESAKVLKRCGKYAQGQAQRLEQAISA
jgi:hypothetical protein